MKKKVLSKYCINASYCMKLLIC